MESNDLLFDLKSQHKFLLNKMQHNQAKLNIEMTDLDFSFCKKELIKLRSENERLKLELEKRENTLLEQLAQIQSLQLKQVSKTENADFVKERDEQNLIKSSEKEVKLDATFSELISRIEEKDNEISELSHQLYCKSNKLHQTDLELKDTHKALQIQKKYTQRSIALCKQQNEDETGQLHKTISKIYKCINCLESELSEKKQELKETNEHQESIKRLKIEVDRLNVISGAAKKKEAKFENNYRLFKDSENERELAVSKLNEIINKQNKEIQHLQEEIDKRNHKITTLEEVRLRCSHVEQALKKTKANKAELHETLKVLQNQNQEQEHRISQLTHQMNESLESFNQRESDLKEVEFSLQNKIQTLETDLEHHKEEITYEKQVSKSLQIKMTELSKNMESLMNEKEMREKENKDTNDYLSGIIDSQIEKIQHLENLVQQQDKKKMSKGEEEAIKEVKAMEKKMTDLKDQLKHTLGKLHVAETELNETKSRLSRVMGDRLTENNPNITDLSDRNRPTKIAEKCAELYDNQWTDAFDVLEKHFNTEEVVIEVLLHILQDIMSFCQTMAKRQLEVIKQEITFTRKQDGFEVPSDIQKLLKDLRKAMASAVVENLKKIYVSQLELSGDKILRAALDVDEYTSECIEICWFMVVQDPPVVFGPLPKEGSSFDTDFYKPYTKSGTHVEYSVWPSLLLHEGGPILAKGVAQGHGQRVKYV